MVHFVMKRKDKLQQNLNRKGERRGKCQVKKNTTQNNKFHLYVPFNILKEPLEAIKQKYILSIDKITVGKHHIVKSQYVLN